VRVCAFTRRPFLSDSLCYTGVSRAQACCSSRRARCCSGVFRLEDQTTRDVVVGFSTSTSLTQWWGRYPNIGKGSLGPSVSQRSRHGFQNPPVPDVRLDIHTLAVGLVATRTRARPLAVLRLAVSPCRLRWAHPLGTQVDPLAMGQWAHGRGCALPGFLLLIKYYCPRPPVGRRVLPGAQSTHRHYGQSLPQTALMGV
jgi:hypothetical protein